MTDDLRFALRGLARAPGFTLAASLTIALGIGANAMIFAIIDRLLLRPPAEVADPARVMLIEEQRDRPLHVQSEISYPLYRDLARSVAGFASVAMYTPPAPLSLGRGAGARAVRAQAVSDNYFATLGVRPRVGRFFTTDDGREPGGAPVVVIGEALWRGQFGGTREALGRPIVLGVGTYTIIGVAPRAFAGIDGAAADVWIPVAAAPDLRPGGDWSVSRRTIWATTIARLAPGVTPPVAAAQATTVRRAAPDNDARNRSIVLASILPAAAAAGDPTARVATLLAGVTAFVLLIACANVSNLLLSRAARRRREIAVRLALGVSRRRLIGQLLVEVLLLATLGGAGALAIAHAGGSVLRTVFFPGRAWSGSPVDARVLVIAAVLTALTTLAAGLVPALQATRLDLTSALRQGTRAGTAYHTRTRRLLLVVQAAMSLVLLVGAGLFVMSLRSVGTLPLGMDVDRLVVGSVSLPDEMYPAARQVALLAAMRERVRGLPGIAHVSLATTVPFSYVSALRVFVPGRDSVPSLATGGPYLTNVTSDYFTTMGARLTDGRAFHEPDERTSEAVVIVNRTLAATYWPGGRAVGECLIIGARANPCSTVVGVVEDLHRAGVFESPSAQIYRPLHPDSLTSRFHARVLIIRPEGDPARAMPAIRQAMQTAASDLPVVDVAPLADNIASDYRPWRLGASVFVVFGGLALVLAALGMFSVLSYTVAQRGHEMAVRVALGATRGHVLGLVLGGGLRVTGFGIAIGIVASIALAGVVAPLLHGVGAADPRVYASAIAVLVAAAAAASVLPAWRATRVQPASALRGD